MEFRFHLPILVVVLLVGLICRIAFSLFTPAYYAPDEIAHWHYIEYMKEHWQLPVTCGKTDAASEDWENYQPPLYYAFSAASLLVFPDSLLTVRLLSIALWAVTMFFAIKTLGNLGLSQPPLVIFVVTLVACLPSYVFLSSVVNNDNLVNTLGAAFAFLMSKPNTLKNRVVAGIIGGLAIWTKISASLLITIPLIMVAHFLARRKIHDALPNMATVVIVSLAFLPLAFWNLHTWGSITATDIATFPRQWQHSLGGEMYHIWLFIEVTFWAVSGRFNNVLFFPQPLIALMYIGIGGLIVVCSESSRMFAYSKGFLFPAAGSILLACGMVVFYGLMFSHGHGRHLYFLLVPFSTLLSIGWSKVFSGRKWMFIPVTFCLYCVAFVFLSLARFPSGIAPGFAD